MLNLEAQSWILDDLGLILGPPEARFLCFFEDLSLQLAGSAENVTTYEKHAKIMYFYRFLACSLLRARFEN